MKCINESLSTLTIPEIDEIVDNNWEESLPDKSVAPSYVSTYINNDKSNDIKDLIFGLGEKILNIGTDFKRYINSFDSIKFKSFVDPTEIDSNYSVISDYTPDSSEKYALVGINGDGETIIGALPPKNPQFINTSLLIDRLASIKSEFNVNKDKFLELISNAYQGKTFRANPVSLSKRENQGIRQTLSELKASYGNNYKYIFSSPHIVTGKFSVNEDYTGRTVIFYNKYPETGLSVDSIIADYGGVNRKHQNKMLGMIPLQNAVYTDLDSILKDVDNFSGEDLNNGSYGLFASSPSLKKFYDLLIENSKTSLSDFAEGINQFKNETSDGFDGDKSASVAIYNPSAKNFINYLRRLKNSDNGFYTVLNNILQDNIEEDFKGIYVNPIILKNFTEYKSGIARVDSSLGDLLFDKLYIDGLRPNVIQPQRLEFKFSNTISDINDLFNPDYKSPISNTFLSSYLEYKTIEQHNVGKEIKPAVAQVLGEFEKYGISAYDIDIWVKNVTSEILLNSDKENFGVSLQGIMNQITSNNGDCI